MQPLPGMIKQENFGTVQSAGNKERAEKCKYPEQTTQRVKEARGEQIIDWDRLPQLGEERFQIVNGCTAEDGQEKSLSD